MVSVLTNIQYME